MTPPRGLGVVVLGGGGHAPAPLLEALEQVVAALTARGHRALVAPPEDPDALLASPHDARVVCVEGPDDPSLAAVGGGPPALAVGPANGVLAALEAGAAAALLAAPRAGGGGARIEAERLARALDALLGALERRAREEAWAASQAALLDALPLGALVVVDGAVAHANPALADMAGAPGDDLVGRPLASLFAAEDGAEVRRRAAARAAWAGEVRLQGGGAVRLTMVEAAWRGGSALHVLAREASPDAVAARERAEAGAQAAARDDLVFLGGLVQALVHDLRNPLQATLFALASARGGPRGQPALEALSTVERKVREIDAMLAEVHEVAQPWRPTLLPFPAAELLHGARAAVHAGAAERGVELVVDDAGAAFDVQVDPPRLKHALTNLAWLAVEASPPGGQVSLRAGRDGSGWWWLEVEDERAAAPGGAAQAAAPSGRGARRRLAIARRIVEAHGAALRLEGREPCGLRARVVLGG
ncbi:MAG: PAS domain-containing protein [Planctomycetes bacterium]|nr:PAS domain-containing protein [Planctomycetota bacterium]